MIISHKYRFIFIKTAKTAGTSLEIFLSQCCGENDVVTPIWPPVEPHRARNYRDPASPASAEPETLALDPGERFRQALQANEFYNHMPARVVRERVSKKVWEQYFKFCVERNPWDKSLSHYHMVNSLAGGAVSLDEYIARGSFCINFPKYTDAEGALLVDKVLEYESLTDELAQVFGSLGIPFEGTLGVRAKSEYRTDRRPYQEVFTSEQGEAIGRAFREEIAMHGYVF